MRAVFARLVPFVVLACFALPSSAAAWTRTEVRGMRARAEVMPSGWARIGLEITIDVQGGWVERFEIAGLGAGAKLDPLKPPTWWKVSPPLDDTDATPGTKYIPALQLRDDGTLTMDFGRRATAPRRGTFRCRVVYEARLPSDGGGGVVVALPTWPSALEDVELFIEAPRGSVLAPAGEGEHEPARVHERGAITTAHLVKPQLPRTHSLEARLALPSGGDPARAAAPEPPAPSRAEGEPSPEAFWIAALALALIACKRATLAAPRAREPLFTAAKAIVIALACGAFPYVEARSAAAGAAALALAVALGLSLPAALHAEALGDGVRYRRAHALDIARARRERLARWLGPGTWLDATTPSGCALLAALGALALLALERTGGADGSPWLSAWAALLPLFLVHTRLSRKPNAGDALLALLPLLVEAPARGALAEVARAHGATARLEVAIAATCDRARHARLVIEHERLGPRRELSLVLAEDASRARTLAWLLTRDGRSVLRPALAPALELPALLAEALARADRAALAHAA